MKFNRLAQEIHLISSMIMLSFMMIYVITGILMINHDLFTLPEIRAVHSTRPVENPMDGDVKSYARDLKRSLDLKGRTAYRQDNQKNWIFNFDIPGEAYQIKLTPAQDTLYVTQSTQDMNFYLVAHRIHILRGFKGGWAYTAWAVMYDTTCFAMVLFAVTGIILWYKRRKQYRHGWRYLLAGLLVPLFFIYAFVSWK